MPRLLDALAAALFVAVSGGAAGAQVLGNLVEICGDADRSPAEALKFCYRALGEPAMDSQPAAVRAKVLMNAGVAAFDLGRFGEAADNQTRALEIDPGLSDAYLNRAQAYERSGRAADALADYEAALALEPNDANIHLGRGVLRLKQGDASAALADFDQAARLEPDWSAPVFNRGVVNARLGRWAEAEADFSTVIARNPDDAQALVNRGQARAALGRAGAGADFDRALELRPEWGAGWFARGQFHEQAGNQEAANADYMRAYQLGHSDPRLIERVRRIGGG